MAKQQILYRRAGEAKNHSDWVDCKCPKTEWLKVATARVQKQLVLAVSKLGTGSWVNGLAPETTGHSIVWILRTDR
jgi:hypothetical protein